MRFGEQVAGDIIVAATGFNYSVLRDIDFTIANKPLNFADTVTYRGMMFSGVPSLVCVFRYVRASWTLRTAVLAEFVCHLLWNRWRRSARTRSRR
jgi:cation diffusion facilitator CzcD-associated flavoprotein CzcO